MVTLVLRQEGEIKNIYPLEDVPVTLEMQSTVGYSIPASLNVNTGTIWATNGVLIGQIAEVEDYQFVVQSNFMEVQEAISPISTKGDKVIFDTKQMVVGKSYRYIDKNKPYIAIKNQDNSIDIYRVHHR